MKVVLAVTLAEPGGVQQFLAGFAVWLKKQEFDVTVIAGDGQWLADRCREAEIPFIRLKKVGREINPLRDPAAIMELRRVLKDLKPDAIELNSAKMGVVGSIAAWLAIRDTRCAMRVVYRIGGWTFREVLPAHKLWLYRTAEKWTAPLKDVIVCVNPDDVRLANEIGIKAREAVVAVPNGIDLEKFDSALLPRDQARKTLADACGLRMLAEEFIFGTTSNFYPPKDLPRYMEACKVVHNAEPDARFLILGDGMQRSEIESKRDALGLKDVVLLPGARDDASALLAGFDAFVLPSSKEGMSFSLLEAMAARLPCVATDVGAAKWMLEEDGLVVPKMDPRALANAMLRVMRETGLKEKLGQGARRQIESRFPLEATYRGNLKALTG